MSWNQEKISDVAIIGDGAHASIKRVETGVPYLTSKNFKADGLDTTKLDFISESDYQKHFKEKSKALTKHNLTFKLKSKQEENHYLELERLLIKLNMDLKSV